MITLNNNSLNQITTENRKSFDPSKNKVIQFGGGNFLRAFVDFYLDKLNKNDLLDSGVTLIQAIPQDTPFLSAMKEQDYNYTLIERGMENGEVISRNSVIDIITDVINPYDDFNAYLACARSEYVRFVVSNTTEAGIVYDENAKLEDAPQNSFPAKVTRFLYERFNYFSGNKEKGVVFLPCELIDNNGSTLKEYVLKHAQDWNLEKEFIEWVQNYNYFTNTLVDRIVPGFPKDEIEELHKAFNYIDNFVVTTELFNFWVIEGPTWLQEELPFHKLGLNVVWTDDATPFKSRKVRILNGGHTSTVLAAYLAGYRTVGEMMEDANFDALLNKILFDEVIPTLDLPKDDLIDFANSVFDRFRNPFIKHYLYDISLNSVSKYKARVTPSIVKYYEIYNKIPTALTFSFASLICFYRGKTLDGASFELRDDASIVEYFSSLWADYDNGSKSLEELVTELCAKEDYFGANFNNFDGFNSAVVEYCKEIIADNITNVIEKITK